MNHEIGTLLDETFAGLKPSDAMDNLSGICYGEEEGNYTKHLTEDEINVAKSKLADESLKILKIEEKKKEAMDQFKEDLKKPKEVVSELLTAIRFKSVSKEGRLYLMDDQEKGIMYKYDEQGVCVDSRALLPNERQGVIRMNQKAV